MGTTMVVEGEGVNMPRIQIESRPVSFFQAFLPALVILLSDLVSDEADAVGGLHSELLPGRSGAEQANLAIHRHLEARARVIGQGELGGEPRAVRRIGGRP